MQRPQKDVIGGAVFDDARRVHHIDAVGVASDHAKIVRDDDQRDVEPPRQFLHQLEDLRLDGNVERGGRLVGDDELGIAGEPDRDHHALAHAAGELMRILFQPPRAVGDADELQQFERTRLGLCVCHLQVDEQRLHDLLADREHRVERGHRLLEDHRDVAAADRAHLVGGQFEQVAAFEQHAPLGHAAGGFRQQAHDGERRYRLAAAGFADDGDHFAALDRVGNAVDRVHDAARGVELDVQILHRQQRCWRT